MSSNFSRVGRFLGHVVFAFIAVGFFLWSWAAFSVQLSGIFYYVCVVAVFIAVMAAFVLRRRARRLGWVGLVAIFAVLGIWYQGFEPAEDRDWAFDVAHGVQPHVDGDQITLSKVRNFEWTDETSANESWEDRSFDISKLQSVDMFTSVWDHPSIAHLLVSFGFSDGQRVVFSLETRKESHEAFNLLGGFFRQFELILLATTEEDAIKLRTNYRQEDVRRYEVNLSPEQRRDLFMSYIYLGQDMQAEPKFYNTLTSNCTTEAYRIAKVVKPRMNADWRLVLSGHLAAFVDDMGGFQEAMPIEQRMEEAAITPTALAYTGTDFSAAIRN
ncbi:DUF4105 domain-containing protein [Tateyamaria sp.]|uniref:DUF4105 domain-containing protein n=1 Tax=Tateyamaria sp. TaxID=1929288 RepID=UPI00329AD224